MSLSYVVTIQSANRANLVKQTELNLHPIKPIWYVPADQINEYVAVSQSKVVGIGGKLPMKARQLNVSTRTTGFDVTVTMDDDFIKAWSYDGKEIWLGTVITECIKDFASSKFKVAGLCNTFKPKFTKQESEDYGMIFGGFMFHREHNIRFDESLNEMEDIDFIIKHHKQYGGIFKINRFLVNFHTPGVSKKLDKKYIGGYTDLSTPYTRKITTKLLNDRYKINVDNINWQEVARV